MKAVVVGGGSIGTRHLQNLHSLGIENLALVESDAIKRNRLAEAMRVSVFSRFEEGLDWAPDFAVIATPSHLHLPQAMEVARRDIDLFVEKPLSSIVEGLDELAELIERKHIVSMVGCNMRFHPGPAKVKELLLEGGLGKILFARIHTSSFLPDWRPTADYRQTYSANQQMGGGCILDCIHEIDLARWYLGDVVEVLCLAGHISSLEISAEDVAAIICRHASGALSEIHLDYVQRAYERGCNIAGETGSIFWDFNTGIVRRYDAVAGWTSYCQESGWQINQMYIDEMQHFINCCQTRKATMLPIPEALAVQQIAFAAKTSSRTGRLVATASEVLA
jgi:Predicted dehydrogenases and related proteins